ncbi:MAG: AMP-binding protein [Myxococcota bacterium]|nr:AMP-binding protein [Myxococcota bacterium]
MKRAFNIEVPRQDLDREVLAWMAEPRWLFDEKRFDSLARRLFSFQFEHCPAYGRYCEGRGVNPGNLSHWTQIPPVPTGAFKEIELRCFPAEQTLRTFRTSGTSGQKQGALHLDTLEIYEASLIRTLEHLVFPDYETHPTGSWRLPMCILAPTGLESPNSSLSHMFDQLVQAHGSAETEHVVRHGTLDLKSLQQTQNHVHASGLPWILLGTAFSFVHLLEDMTKRGEQWKCPPGSRVMETGGFKGQSREIPRADLHGWISERMGIPLSRIINQYGMTELGSQFYDSTLVDPGGPRRKLGPPWVRVRILDPKTRQPVEPGETGMVVIHDLANTGSVAAIETADLGHHILNPQGKPVGFEILGREPDAEKRGCSIAADEMLTRPRGHR